MSSPARTLGNYILGPLIGRGGMSEVYVAKHRATGETVAIKLLRFSLASDPAAIEAFAQEAAKTRAIEHPNVVQMKDFGSDADAFYLVMERLEGETLAARLKRGPLDEAAARELGAAIADGVAAAHERGIVHRDLKPGNIVLVGGAPKIVDFGIARYIGGNAPATTATMIGTPAYMAPEQIAGGLIASCVDVWALGVVLFEMVTGRVPFDTSGGACPQLHEAAPRLAAPISSGYAALVAACLEREPRRRPATIGDVAHALRDSSERMTEDVAAVSPAPSQGAELPTVPPRRRWRGLVAAGGAIAAGVIAALVWRSVGDTAELPPPVSPAPAPPVQSDPPTASTPPPFPPPAADDPPAGPVSLAVRSSPGEADIAVDGVHLGTTPATIAVVLPATIVVTRRGYEPAAVHAEHAGAIDVDLVPLPSEEHHGRVRPPRPSKPRAGETLD